MKSCSTRICRRILALTITSLALILLMTQSDAGSQIANSCQGSKLTKIENAKVVSLEKSELAKALTKPRMGPAMDSRKPVSQEKLESFHPHRMDQFVPINRMQRDASGKVAFSKIVPVE